MPQVIAMLKRKREEEPLDYKYNELLLKIQSVQWTAEINNLLILVAEMHKVSILLDLNMQDKDQNTPLLWAIKHKDYTTIDKLLPFAEKIGNDNKPLLDLNGQDEDQNTPLSWAIKHKDYTTIDKLLPFAEKIDNDNKPLLDLNRQDKDQDTPLSWAIKHKDYTTIGKLLPFAEKMDNDNKPLLDLNLQDKDYTKLFLSINYNLNALQPQVSNDREIIDINTNNTKFLHIESGQNNRSLVLQRPSSPKFSIGTPFLRLVISDTYVDKTKLVMEFADYSSSGTDVAVYLITAPRKFGKSKNMEMIKCCLGIELDANNKVLPFTDTHAYKTLKAENDKPHKTISIIEDARFCQAHFAKYPVIFIDCKNATGLTYDDVLEAYRDQIRSTFMEHEYLLKIWKDQNKNNTSNEIKQLIEQFERYIGFETLKAATLKNGLKILSQWIQKYLCNKKTGDDGCVIILMDEYDAAISFAVNTNQVSCDNMAKIHGFFDDIYSAAFKDNPALFKGLITGISGLVKASAGSRFNNAVHCKFLDKENKFQKYYGLSVEEVDFILKTINENSNQILKQKITQYYNGYYNPANNSSLYNLWSVIQKCLNIFLSKNQKNIVDADDNVECESQDANEELRSYWIESGSIKSLNHIFKMPDIRKIIELLIAKGQINFTFKESLDVDSLYILKNLVSSDINDEGVNLFFSYIVELGYLSRQPTNDYIIPNEEIRQEFIKKLCEYFNSTYNIQKELKDAISMFNALIKIENQECIEKQQECFVGALNALFKKMCFADMKGIAEGNHPNEDLFHSVLNLIIMQSLKLCKFGTEITSNNDLIRGRADIVFITKDGIGGIIEVKYDEDAVLQQLVDRALQQIEEKKYEHIFVEHINHGIMNNILKIGIGCNMHLPKNQNRCEPIIDMKCIYSSINDEMVCNDTSETQLMLMGCNNVSDLSAT